MASTLIWALRFLHILAGVAWVGGAFIWIMVIAPRLLARGPPPIRRPVLEALVHAIPRYFYTAGGATILFGVLLLGSIHGWDHFFAVLQGTYGYPNGGGIALGLGLLLAILMLLEGYFVITPTADKMLAIMQSMPAPAPGTPPGPPPAAVQAELAALGKKMGIAGMTNVLMGTVAIAAMTWAVNTVR